MSTTCEQFVAYVLGGTSVRVSAKDLLHLDSGAVTTGADVDIDMYNPDGSFGESGIVSNDGDDWFADFVMPDIPGVYSFQIHALFNDASWYGEGLVQVR